jgi:hypothetical protein
MPKLFIASLIDNYAGREATNGSITFYNSSCYCDAIEKHRIDGEGFFEPFIAVDDSWYYEIRNRRGAVIRAGRVGKNTLSEHKAFIEPKQYVGKKNRGKNLYVTDDLLVSFDPPKCPYPILNFEGEPITNGIPVDKDGFLAYPPYIPDDADQPYWLTSYRITNHNLKLNPQLSPYYELQGAYADPECFSKLDVWKPLVFNFGTQTEEKIWKAGFLTMEEALAAIEEDAQGSDTKIMFGERPNTAWNSIVNGWELFFSDSIADGGVINGFNKGNWGNLRINIKIRKGYLNWEDETPTFRRNFRTHILNLNNPTPKSIAFEKCSITFELSPDYSSQPAQIMYSISNCSSKNNLSFDGWSCYGTLNLNRKSGIVFKNAELINCQDLKFNFLNHSMSLVRSGAIANCTVISADMQSCINCGLASRDMGIYINSQYQDEDFTVYPFINNRIIGQNVRNCKNCLTSANGISMNITLIIANYWEDYDIYYKFLDSLDWSQVYGNSINCVRIDNSTHYAADYMLGNISIPYLFNKGDTVEVDSYILTLKQNNPLILLEHNTNSDVTITDMSSTVLVPNLLCENCNISFRTDYSHPSGFYGYREPCFANIFPFRSETDLNYSAKFVNCTLADDGYRCITGGMDKCAIFENTKGTFYSFTSNSLGISFTGKRFLYSHIDKPAADGQHGAVIVRGNSDIVFKGIISSQGCCLYNCPGAKATIQCSVYSDYWNSYSSYFGIVNRGTLQFGDPDNYAYAYMSHSKTGFSGHIPGSDANANTAFIAQTRMAGDPAPALNIYQCSFYHNVSRYWDDGLVSPITRPVIEFFGNAQDCGTVFIGDIANQSGDYYNVRFDGSFSNEQTSWGGGSSSPPSGTPVKSWAYSTALGSQTYIPSVGGEFVADFSYGIINTRKYPLVGAGSAMPSKMTLGNMQFAGTNVLNLAINYEGQNCPVTLAGKWNKGYNIDPNTAYNNPFGSICVSELNGTPNNSRNSAPLAVNSDFNPEFDIYIIPCLWKTNANGSQTWINWINIPAGTVMVQNGAGKVSRFWVLTMIETASQNYDGVANWPGANPMLAQLEVSGSDLVMPANPVAAKPLITTFWSNDFII